MARKPPDDPEFWKAIMEGNESLLPSHRTTDHPHSRRWKSAPRDLRDEQPQTNPLRTRRVKPW